MIFIHFNNWWRWNWIIFIHFMMHKTVLKLKKKSFSWSQPIDNGTNAFVLHIAPISPTVYSWIRVDILNWITNFKLSTRHGTVCTDIQRLFFTFPSWWVLGNCFHNLLFNGYGLSRFQHFRPILIHCRPIYRGNQFSQKWLNRFK